MGVDSCLENVWAVAAMVSHLVIKDRLTGATSMALTLGIDVAVRAAHQATLARDGATVWRGRKFWTRPADLDRLWADLDLADPAELTVVVEPTRNAWIVVAEWFRRRGARVVMVPTTQSADLRGGCQDFCVSRLVVRLAGWVRWQGRVGRGRRWIALRGPGSSPAPELLRPVLAALCAASLSAGRPPWHVREPDGPRCLGSRAIAA